MSYKIAVATTDGKYIDQHFGSSKEFHIFEVDDNGEYIFVEIRKKSADNEGENSHKGNLKASAEILSDCSKVLVAQIGLGAEQFLKSKGITAYSVSDRIDNALIKLINYDRNQKRRNANRNTSHP